MLKKYPNKTAWKGEVGKWYKKVVGIEGSYYHREVILPNLWRLLELKKEEKLVDFGCGQGIVGRKIENEYLGIDLSKELIEEAKKLDKKIKHSYIVADLCQEVKIEKKFDKGVMVLALQNVKRPFKVMENFSRLLKNGGEIVLVINHPCFRIPKHSDWEMKNEKQYRIIDTYMSPLEIPIESSPFDKKNNQISFSYHYPLSSLVEMLTDNNFLVEKIEEWVSNKKSEGKMAIIEDRARAEFPLFLAIKAIKK